MNNETISFKMDDYTISLHRIQEVKGNETKTNGDADNLFIQCCITTIGKM